MTKKKATNAGKKTVMSAKTVAQKLKTYNQWRRGEGKYAYSDDPMKVVPMPFSSQHLGIVIERAVELLSGIAR